MLIASIMKLFGIFIFSLVVFCSGFRNYRSKTFIPNSLLTASSSLQTPSTTTRSASGDFGSSGRESKPYSKLIGSKPYSRGNSNSGGGGSGGYGRGNGNGGRSFHRRPPGDSLLQLKFSKTVKIDPEYKTLIQDMKFSEKTSKVLTDKGFTEMTPVQSQSYDYVYSGQDVVARSRTGTGKTLAFGIPIIERLIAEKKITRGNNGNGLPWVLILEPTRELALQVAQELGNIAAVHGLKVAAIYGGTSMFPQERDLRNGVHIIVATPGRALDHIGRGTMDLSSVEHVVLDEGDTMLEMGFQNDVESIIANVKTPGEDAKQAATRALASRDKFDDFIQDEDDLDVKETLLDFTDKQKARDVQVLLYSATMPGWICKLTNKHMKDPIFLDAVQEGETRLANTIKHYAIRLPRSDDRVRSVSSSVEDLILTHGGGGQTIVFTNTKDEADSIIASDGFGQLRAQVLHGDISQSGRQNTIKQFKEGQIDVLVATDVAARGLDIAGVDLVVHSGPPNDHDTYVHRSGRTGRAGRNGTSVMLYSYSGEVKKLEDFERNLNFRFQKTNPPSPSDVARASAWYASKKLEKVDDIAMDYFLPHAKEIVHSLLQNEGGYRMNRNNNDNDDEEEGEENDENNNNDDDDENRNNRNEIVYSSEEVSQLFARCLAALSNKQTIQTRSLLTGELGKTSLLINAVFKNGTSPSSARDWQRVFLGIVRKALNLEDISVGRVAMGINSRSRQYYGIVDVDTEQARTILKMISDNPEVIPKGIEIMNCEKVPEIIEDNSRREYSESGSRGGGYGLSDRDSGSRGGYSRSGSSGSSNSRSSSSGSFYGRDRDNSGRGRERSYFR